MDLKRLCFQIRPATESQDSVASLKILIFVSFTNKISSKLVYSCPLSGAYEFQ
jgi:hypothetical protein